MAVRGSRWIADFVDELSSVPSAAGFTNFYSPRDEENAVRRHNLTLYFRDVRERAPRVLMVGECPGYRGTKVTGVPFADAPIVLGGIRELGMFGVQNGYRPPLEEHYPKKEQTSTVMWRVLAQQQLVPLLWASFPFHSYGDELDTNRTPSTEELLIGKGFLQKILRDWSIETVIAVGRVAERTLGTLGVQCSHVRHPARGGEREFSSGIAALPADGIGSNSPAVRPPAPGA